MEQEIRLKAYKEEIEVLSLTIDIPEYARDDKRKDYFYNYEDVLTKLFNNQREDKDILEIENYYSSNKITIRINLKHYIETSYYDDKEEAIEHLKTWLTSNLDIANNQVETKINKGYIYTIDQYHNKIEDFDENDNRVYNYSIME